LFEVRRRYVLIKVCSGFISTLLKSILWSEGSEWCGGDIYNFYFFFFEGKKRYIEESRGNSVGGILL
jgi:hypothetical protein